MFVLSVLEAPNTKTNSLCVQTHLAIKLFLSFFLSSSSFTRFHTRGWIYELIYPIKHFDFFNAKCMRYIAIWFLFTRLS